MRVSMMLLAAACATTPVRTEAPNPDGPPLLRVDRAEPFSKLLEAVRQLRADGTFRSTLTCSTNGAWFKLSHATRDEAGPVSVVSVAKGGFQLDGSEAMDLGSMRPRLEALKPAQLLFVQDPAAPVGNLCDVMESTTSEPTFFVAAP